MATLLIFITGNVEEISDQVKMITEFEDLLKEERFIDASEWTYDPKKGMGPDKEHFIFHNKYDNEYRKGLFAISKEIFIDPLPKELEIQNESRYGEYLYDEYIKLRSEVALSDTEQLIEKIQDTNEEMMFGSQKTYSNEVEEEVGEFLKSNLVVEGVKLNGLELKLYHTSYDGNNADVLFLNEMLFNNEAVNWPINNLIHFSQGTRYKEHSLYSLFDGIVKRPCIFYRYDIPKVYLGWLKSHGIEIRTEFGTVL